MLLQINQGGNWIYCSLKLYHLRKKKPVKIKSTISSEKTFANLLKLVHLSNEISHWHVFIIIDWLSMYNLFLFLIK